jgi:hypothetical protein
MYWGIAVAFHLSEKHQFIFRRSQGIKVFSSCSVDEFKQLASQPELDCLRNTSETEFVVQPQGGSYCGNHLLEVPEQCDCGPPEVRQKLSQLSTMCSVCTDSYSPVDFYIIERGSIIF